jgi:hypothetical protein
MKHPSTSPAILAALLFSAACRQAERPCSERSLMSAERYWAHFAGPRNIWTESETDQFLCVAIQLEEGQERYRVDKRSLLDRRVKEEVFRTQVEGSVDFLRIQRAHSGDGPSEMLDFHFQILEGVTGLPLRSTQEWIDWFDANHERLRLSPDGERLIVSSE